MMPKSYYFSSSFLKFTKCYLEHADMSDIDPECHGPTIAAEIVDCSSLTTECIKCTRNAMAQSHSGYVKAHVTLQDTFTHDVFCKHK